MFWLLTLPFRLVFSVVGLAFGLVGLVLAVVAGVGALVLLPLGLLFWAPFMLLRAGLSVVKFFVGGFFLALAAIVVFAVALVPLLPLLLLGGGLWLLLRLLRPRPVASW